MINAVILGYDYALSTSITGLADLLSLAGVSWNRLNNTPPERLFNLQIASDTGKPFTCLNSVEITPHISFGQIESPDIVLVPTIGGNIERTLFQNRALIDYLSGLKNQDILIASNCTGAFLLAEAGLLDGKQATTHWGFVDLFRSRYPAVNLMPGQLVTHDGNILCAGGGNAWFDLGLYMVERFSDHETAVGSAKTFVIDMGRQSQLSYSPLISKRYHNDEKVLEIQTWMESNHRNHLSLSDVANAFHISLRTLNRRFKSATGETPNVYLQSLRLESAKKLLEETSNSLTEVTNKVGYDDVSSFSILFKKKTGLTPGQYRERYRSSVATCD
ncbi:MAG: AraC family transcriptional regulator [Proteobacteria bacterium]|nr:MAG: AraC family transcriptional regulator [Pseudomonadota bacterium]